MLYRYSSLFFLIMFWLTLFLFSMFSGRYKILQDRDGRFFLDRDGSMFGHILNFLRYRTPVLSRLPAIYSYLAISTGQMSILNLEDLQQLRLEADFFAIQPLLRLIDQRISVSRAKSVGCKQMSSLVSLGLGGCQAPICCASLQ